MEREDRCYLCGILPPYTNGPYTAEDRLCKDCITDGRGDLSAFWFAVSITIIFGAILIGFATVGGWIGGCIAR